VPNKPSVLFNPHYIQPKPHIGQPIRRKKESNIGRENKTRDKHKYPTVIIRHQLANREHTNNK
jgi:hypothetical protein